MQLAGKPHCPARIRRAHLMRIGFARHGIGKPQDTTRMERSAASRETCHRKVETAPEEMDRTNRSKKATAEELEDPLDLDEGTPEPMYRVGIVGSVDTVFREADGIGHLVREVRQPLGTSTDSTGYSRDEFRGYNFSYDGNGIPVGGGSSILSDRREPCCTRFLSR